MSNNHDIDPRTLDPIPGFTLNPDVAPLFLASLPLGVLWRAVIMSDWNILVPSDPRPPSYGGLNESQWRDALLAALDLRMSNVQVPPPVHAFLHTQDEDAIRFLIDHYRVEFNELEEDGLQQGQTFIFIRLAIAELLRRRGTQN